MSGDSGRRAGMYRFGATKVGVVLGDADLTVVDTPHYGS
jgi:hypothetical protein